MDALENTTTPATPASEQPWSEDVLFFFVGHRLPEPLFESQLPSDHPLFVQREMEVLKRRREKGGRLVGTYEVVETFWVIELRRAGE